MKEETNKRCNESKKICDIFHDMQMGKDDLSAKQNHFKTKRLLYKTNKDFAEAIIKIMTMYVSTMEEIDYEREDLAAGIVAMEEFYNEQEKVLAEYKHIIEESDVDVKMIKKSIHDAQVKFNLLCKITVSLSKRLKSFIDELPYEEDRDIQNKITNDLLLQFEIQRYDISEIISQQLELLYRVEEK